MTRKWPSLIEHLTPDQAGRVRRRSARAAPAGQTADGLTPGELNTVLSALWLWRAQLGRVGCEQPIAGLSTAKARKGVEEIARKLGGDPGAYFFGVEFSMQMF
jgi:hypothetical protein